VPCSAGTPKLLLLDEPFAGLGSGEIEPLATLIRKLHRSEGLTILIIEHKLREFMQLVESVIAMDFGEIVAIDDPSTIVRHPRVVEAYMGKAELGLPNIESTGAGDVA
jgi:branched-chain amino acid transport system ATP-binding protein